MASTYGEISEPVSRTAWEDWDDMTEENNIKLEWLNNVAAPEAINTLLILEGKYLHDCFTSQTDGHLELLDFVKEIGLCMYKVDQPMKYICVIKDYNLLHSSEIIELLKPYILVSRDVITIQTKPLAEYQSFELTSQNCIIRSVNTTKLLSDDIKIPKLEQPNIISGVSAGVICLREHLDMPGKAVICYVEHPEEYQINDIRALLRKLGIISNTTSRPNNILNSNLYV